MKLVFPIVLVLASVGASIVYGFSGEWRNCIYWAAVAVVNAAAATF